MTESVNIYAKAIGVTIGEDVKLDFIAFKGYNESLPADYKYKISNNTICYENILTGDIYKLHPNYRKYRLIVETFKTPLTFQKTSEIDLPPSSCQEIENNLCNESRTYLKELNTVITSKEKEINLLKQQLIGLDRQFEIDLKYLDDDLNSLKEIPEKLMSKVEFIKIWRSYKEMKDCKKEAKLMYRASKNKLSEIKHEMNAITKSANTNDEAKPLNPESDSDESLPFPSDCGKSPIKIKRGRQPLKSDDDTRSEYECESSRFYDTNDKRRANLRNDVTDDELNDMFSNFSIEGTSCKALAGLWASYDPV